MIRVRPVLAAAILLTISLGAAGVVQAAESTPMDNAELSQLSTQLRAKVEARLVNGQTAHGVLEAMLLNDVSQEFASGQVVATDFQRGDIVVRNTAGQVEVFPFDVAILAIKH